MRFALTFLLLISFAHADEPPANLLQNPSFEETEKDASGKEQPAHWKSDGEIPGVAYSWSKLSGVEKSGAVMIKKTANKYFPIAQWTQSFDYDGKSPALQISAQVKAKNAKKAILDVVFLDDKGEWIEHQWVAYIGQKEPRDKPATHDWKDYSGTIKIPANTKSIVVALQDYGPGDIYFDDVRASYQNELPQSPSVELK